jgi:hypothetical protein
MKKLLLIAVLFCSQVQAQDTRCLTAYVDQHISCNGNNDGYIQANYSEPNSVYTIKGYKFADTNTSGTFQGLKPGNYTVKVNNASISLTVTQPKPLAIKFKVVKPTQTPAPFGTTPIDNEDGSIDATITGGVAENQPHLTFWHRDGVLLNPEENYKTFMEGVSAGTYSLTVEDDQGCFLTKEIKVVNK